MTDHDTNAEINSVAYRDLLLAMILGLVMCIGIIVLMVTVKAAEEVANAKAPGNLSVTIVWPVGNTDVDLWVLGPGEPRAIGYSRKSGKLFDLLRDDLGLTPDATGANFETAFTRGVVAGEYTVNAHAYRVLTVPIVVNVEVAINMGPGAPMRVLVTTSVTLTRNGEEKTAIRFHLEADGTIRDGSMHAVFKPLRSAKS